MVHTYSLFLLSLLFLFPLLSFSPGTSSSFSPSSAPVRFRRVSATRRTSLSWSTGISLVGDASVVNGKLSLTSTGAGRALISQPVRLLDPLTLSPTSFRSRFTFAITAPSPSNPDGLAFLLTSDALRLGKPDGFLGLFSPNTTTDAPTTVAVEFDANYDAPLGDLNGNHVALDVGSIFSNASGDAGTVDLKSGKRITTWVEYDAANDSVHVWVGYASGPRPRRPVLKTTAVGLAGHFQSLMYVGFSASCRGGAAAFHVVERWSFQTAGFPGSSPTVLGFNESSLSGGEDCAPASPDHDEGPFDRPKNPSCPAATPSHPPSRSPREQGKGRSKRRRWRLKVPDEAAITVLVVLVAAGGVTWWRLDARKANRSLGEPVGEGVGIPVAGTVPVGWPPVRMSTCNIKLATRGFQKSKIIGRCGLATVYEGVLPSSGAPVAVKRFVPTKRSANAFARELSAAISRGPHHNLVTLRGWCCDNDDLLLVYDYIPNATLDRRLHSSEAREVAWEQRFRIVLSLASAVAFLHKEGNRKKTVHGDIRASNVLLDGELNARLGDFGVTNSGVSPAGEMGYMAPEYVHAGVASEKTDVYSFGVVALEVATGRRPVERGVALVDWVWRLQGKEGLDEAADGRLRGEFDGTEMEKLLLVGLACTLPDDEVRPTMKRVLRVLKRKGRVPLLPTENSAVRLVTAQAPANSGRATEVSSEMSGFTPTSSFG